MLLLNSIRPDDAPGVKSSQVAILSSAADSEVMNDRATQGRVKLSIWDDENFLSYSTRQSDAEFPLDYDV